MAGRVGFEPTVEFDPDNHLAGGPNRPLWHLPVINKLVVMAEGEGFEPPETLRPQWFSRPSQSSTLPSLRVEAMHIVAKEWPKVN